MIQISLTYLQEIFTIKPAKLLLSTSLNSIEIAGFEEHTHILNRIRKNLKTTLESSQKFKGRNYIYAQNA